MPGADRAQVESACDLTLARYLQNPERYDEERGPLLPWLVQDARGDVLNELRSAAARREVADSDVVELRSGSGNVNQDRSQMSPVDDEALDRADPYGLSPDVLAAIRREAAHLSPEERAVAELIGDGVRETAAYAEVLGIAHLPQSQQRLTVKRVKDRLTRRLERFRERLT